METWQTHLSPAPWQGDHGEIYDANNNVVVFMAVDGERFNHANELLIASAPELLAALKEAYDALDYAQAQVDSDTDRMHLTRCRRKIKPVIDKAEGRTDEE